MKHRSWFMRLVLAAGLVFGATERVAHAQQTTIAMHKCSVYACSNATQLKAEARLAFYSLPLGSIGFVSSAHYPLSAFVRMCAGARGAKEACLITAGDLGAVELDNRVYARAAAIAPIDIPVEVARSAGGADWEIVEGWIFHPNRLVATGRVGIAPLHNLFDPSNWIWMEFYDDRTKQVSKVFTGDLIVVRFVDGSTAQLKMFGPGAPSGHYFHWEPNSERDVNGNPIAYIPPPLPATPSGPGFALTPPWTDASFGSYLPDGVCAFLLSHCEFVASGSAQLDCYYRRLAFPCA